MRRHPWIAAAVALAACGKTHSTDDGQAGATTPEAAVRGLVEGVIAGDLDRARRFLPDDRACELAPPEHRAPCLENARSMRAQIGSLSDDFPAGLKITSIAEDPDAAPPSPELGAWAITFADGHRSSVMTVKIGDRYYAALALRRDDHRR